MDHPVVIGVTVFLGLTLLAIILVHYEEHKHDKRRNATMALLAASEPRKSIDIEV